MRRLVITVTAIAGLAALLAGLPRWTAANTESMREASFRGDINSETPPGLPVCPFPGPELDTFLNHSSAGPGQSGRLWVPACRIAALPAQRIVILTTTRAEFGNCKSASTWQPANVICALEEPLSFLADWSAAHTQARREYAGKIWLTSQPLAWGDHLVSEHRQNMLLALAFSMSILLAISLGRRTREALACREACHGPQEPEVPGSAELLLHWALGRRCRSLPGDLSEEYSSKLARGWSREEADRWYRWQVFHSIAPVMARRAAAALARHGRRG